MPDAPKKFYLTTPIYYVNARPHIGHAYTTVVADVLARRHRLLSHDTFFLTGTDEHGQKIERSAIAAGIPPQQFADQVSASFKSLWDRMGITYNDYIRTTETRHKRGVQKLFQTLKDNGFITLSTYTGQYCVSDEAYVDGPPGIRCPDCGRTTETVSESNYYFRLSAFQLPLLNLIESNDLLITPESRRNEVLSFLRGNTSGTRPSPERPGAPSMAQSDMGANVDVSSAPDPATATSVPLSEAEQVRFSAAATKSPGAPSMAQSDMGGNVDGSPASISSEVADLPRTAAGHPYSPGALKDLSISRTSFKWGIPVPGDEAHVIYVWLDALANYMTAVGYGSDDPTKQAEFEKYWPADLHLVGKEIIRFHCVYWPAFLLALNPRLKHQPQDQPPQLSLEEQRAWIDKMVPKAITAHGWLLFDDSKMSKSKGNIVRTETILEAFGTLCPPQPTPQELSSPATPHALSSFAEDGGSASPPNLAPATPALAATPTGSVPLKGTASAVPHIALGETALAAEVRPPSPHQRDLFASDVLRYFLLREIPFGQDGSFSFDALITRFNADLANGYGNLVSRTLKMISQYFGAVITPKVAASPDAGIVGKSVGAPERSSVEQAIHSATWFADVSLGAFESNDFSLGLSSIQSIIAATDQMMSAEKPWKVDQSTQGGKQKVEEILYTAAESIRILTALLYPILPFATAQVWAQLGLGSIEAAAQRGDLKNLTWGGLEPGTRLGPLSPIFPRAPKELALTMANLESGSTPNTPSDLTSITDAHDAATSPKTEFPESSLASVANPTPLSPEATDGPYPGVPAPPVPRPSRLSNETTSAASPTPTSTFAPDAGPRTGSLPSTNPIAEVAGSTAVTTERPLPPSHTEARPSGPFNTPASTQPISAGPRLSSPETPQITIDDFAKIELRVAKVVVCERIPKADKLLRLEVDLGPDLGRRQILSGIAEWYTPEDLLGRNIVVITNLAPRKMRGLESHGMLLAASTGENGKPALATFAESGIEPGTRLK